MTTVDSVFQTRFLVATVNQIKPVKTPVLDKVFAVKERSLSSNIEFDVETDAEGISVSAPSSSPATVVKKDGYDHVVVPAPRFPEKTPITPAELDKIRSMGSNAPMLAAEKVGQELAKLRARTDRTREFMAIKALSGTVVDGAGKTLVTYTFPNGHKPVLAAKKRWSDSESTPLVDIRAWKELISAATGGAVETFYGFCAADVMDALLEHPKIAELLKNQMGQQLVETGRIGRLAGVETEEVSGTYKDKDGNRVKMMPAGYIAIVGVGYGNTAEAFAPPEDFKAADGIGSGQLPELYFAKSWEEDDPSVLWLKAESRPLPLVKRPGCIVYAKVL